MVSIEFISSPNLVALLNNCAVKTPTSSTRGATATSRPALVTIFDSKSIQLWLMEYRRSCKKITHGLLTIWSQTLLTATAFSQYQALEMLLGNPNVFTVDQRTRVILTHRLVNKGASSQDIQRALVRSTWFYNSSIWTKSDCIYQLWKSIWQLFHRYVPIWQFYLTYILGHSNK